MSLLLQQVNLDCEIQSAVAQNDHPFNKLISCEMFVFCKVVYLVATLDNRLPKKTHIHIFSTGK